LVDEVEFSQMAVDDILVHRHREFARRMAGGPADREAAIAKATEDAGWALVGRLIESGEPLGQRLLVLAA
jgi:hypothetical protein